ncbi:MAG: ATP-binding cassette domain-containing protein [Candidatus Omnitrophota bacterium]
MMIARCIDIKKSFPVKRGYLQEERGRVTAIDGVSLHIEKGSSFGLVGESGSGKTTIGKIILRVLKPDSGSVELKTDKLQVIFQDPYNSLDPKMKIFDILAEGLIIKARYAQGVERKVEDITDLIMLPRSALDKYPHQFSGGERQRIAIGRALATEPEFIVCDEPVSSLDVTIQLQILKLLKDIRKKFNITYLFISHDLRVVRFMCDRVAVMKDGKIVEEGSASDVYSHPAHPYTKLLLSSILDIYPKNKTIIRPHSTFNLRDFLNITRGSPKQIFLDIKPFIQYIGRWFNILGEKLMKKTLLVTTNAQKILHFLIDRPVKGLLETEIQKTTRISKSGINYALRDLVAADFLSRAKRGKTFFYTLNHKSLIVKQLKIIETLTRLNPLIKRLKPLTSKIILFGSSSRGENTLDSDIDLLILSRNKDLVMEQIKKNTSSRKIQSIIYSNLNFVEKKKTDPVFYEQVIQGIVLWEGSENDL